MKFFEQSIKGLYLIEPDTFIDERGAFRRSLCLDELKTACIDFTVCQGNISENFSQYTMRGFHFQKEPSAEAKIITPITGSLRNVVIDLRKNSETFLKWIALEVSSVKRDSLLVPAGCANAFLTMDTNTIIHYYMGDFFRAATYSGFRFNDPYFNIPWPVQPAVISERDKTFPDFKLDQL
jgi:dTDP-4-dehydrorhamnose 3,5-epimerase